MMPKYTQLVASCVTLTWVMTLRTMTLSLGEVTTETPGDNSSVSAGAEGEGFPYFVAGTAYPCGKVDKCTFIVNGSDPLGGDTGLQNPVEEYDHHQPPCMVNGALDISKNWYGYIGEFTLRPYGSRIFYTMEYPEEKCCIKILLYLKRQIGDLRAHMNCIQKQSVVDPLGPQVITLSPSQPSSGCTSNVTASGERRIICRGGRILNSNQEHSWYIAASSCGSPTGLELDYTLVAYGEKGECFKSQTNGGASTRVLSPSRRLLLSSAWYPFPEQILAVVSCIPSLHISAVTWLTAFHLLFIAS